MIISVYKSPILDNYHVVITFDEKTTSVYSVDASINPLSVNRAWVFLGRPHRNEYVLSQSCICHDVPMNVCRQIAEIVKIYFEDTE